MILCLYDIINHSTIWSFVMGTCKVCNEVKSSTEIKDGICSTCRENVNSIIVKQTAEEIEKERKKFSNINKLSLKDVEIIKTSKALTLEEKKDLLIKIFSSEGYSLQLSNENTLQFVKPKEFSLLWAILWLLLFIIGLIIYIFYYMAKKDTIVVITLDPLQCKATSLSNNNSEKGNTEKLIELSKMLEKGLITEEEFRVHKKQI